MKRVILIVLFGLTALAQRRLLTPGDLLLWRSITDPRINAEGQNVVYVENRSAGAGNSSYSNLWLADAKGKQHRQLTTGEWRDWSPRWSPDGRRIAFLSDRSGKAQMYAMQAEGSTAATAIPSGELVPLDFAWSPDGNTLAFTAGGAIYAVPMDAGTAQRLTATNELEFTGEPAWMPDGRSLVCAAGGQIFSIRIADHALRAITHNQLRNSDPVPSPDGSKVAWIAAPVKPQNYVTKHLWVMNADGSRDRMLSGSLDRDPTDPQWSNDSRTVYFLADDQGSTHMYAGRNDGTARQATNRVERLSWFSLADNGRAVTVRSTATEGGNLITFTTDVPGGVVTLAQPNDSLMAERHLGPVEEIRYESEGKSIQAYLVKPPQFDAAKKYPLLLDIRDDPREMYGAEFHLRQQIFASAGYVVLCANPRGTPGYGEEFGHLLRTRFPGDDADDLLRGVDYVIKQGYIDEKRVGVTGGMVAAWLIGHTDRFTGAVLRRPLIDWAADIARAVQSLGVLPWEDPELYTKRSPIYSSGAIRTRTLILAGEGDGQSEQMYYALQVRKVESRLVRTSSAVEEMQAILSWLGK
jgi:dipeptidyl aminopeptidase/acylaminoacyl peptidase